MFRRRFMQLCVAGIILACFKALQTAKDLPQNGADRSVNAFSTTVNRASIDWKECPQSLVELKTFSSSTRPLKMSITLTTHLSMDRMHHLEHICKAWRWQVAAAVYVGHDPTADEEKAGIKEVEDFAAKTTKQGRCGLDIALYKSVTIDPQNKLTGMYPINALRNKALEAVETAMVAFTDVDFIPNAAIDMDPPAVQKLFKFSKSQHSVFVMPCFQPQTNTDLSVVPMCLEAIAGGKDRVRALFQSGDLVQGSAATSPPSHNITDYPRWLTATAPYQVHFKKEYEPFVMLPTEDAPWFDERFIGYGFDKQSYVAALAGWKYHFVVHPEMYLVGLPHHRTAEALDNPKHWRGKSEHWKKDLMDIYFEMFKEMEYYKAKGVNSYKPRKCVVLA